MPVFMKNSVSIIKIHRQEFLARSLNLTSYPHTSPPWLFTTGLLPSEKSWKEFVKADVNINELTHLDRALLKNARPFNLPRTKLQYFLQYMRPWSDLRRCCGKQMSR